MSCRAAVRDSFTRDVNEVISILGCLLVDLHPQPIDKERERKRRASSMVVGRMSYYSRVSSLERKEKQRGKEKSFSSWTFLIIRSGGGGKNVPFEPLSIILTRNGEEEKKTKLTRSGWNPLINWKGTTIECRYELAFWVKWATAAAAAGAALETKKKQNRLTYKMPRIRRVGRNKLLARRRPICTILLWEKRTRPKFFWCCRAKKRKRSNAKPTCNGAWNVTTFLHHQVL